MKDELVKSVTHCPACGSECSIGVDGETHYYIPKQAQEGLEKLGEKIEDSEWDSVLSEFYRSDKKLKYTEYHIWLKENYYPPKSKNK